MNVLSSALMSIETHPFSNGALASLFTKPQGAALRDSAVLFVGAYGYENLCSRKTLRIMADGLAERGISSLRFDPLGTGDSLDEAHVGRDADWVSELSAAAECLLAVSGASKLLVIAQGLGSLLVTQAMANGLAVSAIAHLAPVTNGKAYLRELSMWSTLIDDGLGLRESDRLKDQGSIAGLIMPTAMAKVLVGAKLADYRPAASIPQFVACRADRPAHEAYADELSANGSAVCKVEFTGYDALMLSPTQSKVPYGLIDQLLNWVDETIGLDLASGPTGQLPVLGREALDFEEQSVAFGSNQSLIGTFCRPVAGKPKAVVVFNGSGYDHRSGWGRQAADLGRKLASHGVASLRYDAAGVSDSRPSEGAPEAVLYHDSQLDDVRAAIDFVSQTGEAPIVLAGRCSGAYMSLHTAAQDVRVKATVGINPVVFYWEKNRSLDDALDMRPRTLGEYKSRILSGSLFKRVIRGEVNVPAAVKNLAKSFWQKYNANRERLQRLRGPDGQSTFAIFDAIAERRVPLYLTYSEDDAGFVNFLQYFDKIETAQSRYPNLTIALLPNTDHNLSSVQARQAYLQTVLEAVQKVTA